jgi:hypothetical protein
MYIYIYIEEASLVILMSGFSGETANIDNPLMLDRDYRIVCDKVSRVQRNMIFFLHVRDNLSRCVIS